MKIQTGMQQSQASMTPLADRLEIRNRVRDDVQQTSRTEKQKENPVAEAGRSYVKENPAPDPKEGVVMSISEMGKRAQANPQDKIMAQDKDGSVVRRQEARVREAQEKSQTQEPKNPREAVEAVAKKREEESMKIQSPAQKREEAIMKAEAPKPQTPQEKAKEDDGSVQKAEPKTPKDAIKAVAEKREEEAMKIQSPAQEKEEAIMKAEPPVPGKDKLEDVSLEGTISLKEYQQQKAAEQKEAEQKASVQQAAGAQGNDILKVA